MANDLVPMDQLERMATVFAKSGMFGAKTPEQAMALLLLAQAEGVHPAVAMKDFDVIQGRPAKKAEAMLRSFIAAGGKVEWHAMTDDLADATFSHESGGSARISWDMARAKKAGLTGKDMYTKYPRQMLANRVISEGCRRIYPASTSGLYVPEELRSMINDQGKRSEPKDMGPAEVIPPEYDPDDEGLKSIEQNRPASVQPASPPPAGSEPPIAGGPPITRTATLTDLCERAKFPLSTVLGKAEVQHADEMEQIDYDEAKAMLERRIQRGGK